MYDVHICMYAYVCMYIISIYIYIYIYHGIIVAVRNKEAETINFMWLSLLL